MAVVRDNARMHCICGCQLFHASINVKTFNKRRSYVALTLVVQFVAYAGQLCCLSKVTWDWPSTATA